MRKIIEKQLKFGQVDISSIELDLRSRDEIPQLLAGLQAIYANRKTRNKVFCQRSFRNEPFWVVRIEPRSHIY